MERSRDFSRRGCQVTTAWSAASRNHGELTTFSIIARCPRTGQLGGAVSSADIAAGRLVLWPRSDVGVVATQSWPNLYLAIDALSLLESGFTAAAALAKVLAGDPDTAVRQLGVLDRDGTSSAWTGESCTTWCGHMTGENFAAQGNMLRNADTVEALSDTFTNTTRLDLSERLVQCLEAAQLAGGDKRGRQCSALVIVADEEYPLWDLRVDEHVDPVAELRRIHDIARLELLPLVTGLPTRTVPRGSVSAEFIKRNMIQPQLRSGWRSGPSRGPKP